jgi:imidazole glycerol-phosphate synthase subunit HisH
MSMIVIINFGMGNLGSIQNMFKKIGTPAIISSDHKDIVQADKLVLPGVGSFDNGMNQLDEMGLLPVLHDKVIQNKTPILGICLGMQLMTMCSEEGKRTGLGWIDGATVRFRHSSEVGDLKIPHMGWNSVTLMKDSALFTGMYPEPRFYFVHSYHAVCNNPQDVLTTTHHGYDFVSSFQKGNIMGVQFHPEKSHKFGMQLLKCFAEFC